MNWMRKCKGSISIFLCLILLPMVTYSTMIVDSSRLQSSRISVTNAGDLTMNAALSEYEQILHDMYGLFAVAKENGDNEEQFKNALKGYFKQTIESKILTVDNAGNYVDNFSNWLVDKAFEGNVDPSEISNFLNMQIEEFNYQPVSGAALANPAVMKRQIIDYMKYKGPLSIAATLFKKLDFLKDSGNQAEVVSNKVKYTKALGDMQDPCEVIYAYLISGEYDSHESNPFAGYEMQTVAYNDLVGSDIDTDSWVGDVQLPLNADIYQNPIGDATSGPTNSRNYKGLKELEYASYFYLLYHNAPKFEDSDGWDFTGKSFDEIGNSGVIESGKTISLEPVNRSVNSNSTSETSSRMNDIYNEMQRIVKVHGGSKGYFEDLADDYKCYESNGMLYYDRETETDTSKPVANFLASNGTYRSKLTVNRNGSSTNETRKNDCTDRYNITWNYQDLKDKLIRERYYYLAYNELVNAYEGASNDYYDAQVHEYDEANPIDPDADSATIAAAQQARTQAISGYQDEKNTRTDNLTYSKWCRDDMRDTYINNMSGVISQLRDNSIYKDCANMNISMCEYSFQNLKWKLGFCKDILNVVLTEIGKIETALDAAKTAKSNWETSIGDVNSNSTRQDLQSDFDSTTEYIDENVLADFKQYITTQRDLIQSKMDALDGVKFRGKSMIYMYGRLDEDYDLSDLAGRIDRNSVSGGWDIAKQYASDNFVQCDSVPFVQPIEPIEGLVTFPEHPNPQSESEDEKFIYTIISIATAKKNDMDSETQSSYEAIQNNSSTDSNGNPTGTAAQGVEDEKEKVGSDDPGSPFADAYNAIKGYLEVTGSDMPTGNIPSAEYPDDDGNVDEDSEPAAGLDAAKGILDLLGDLGATIVNSAYLEEYFTEMFTCQTDAIKEGDGTKYSGFNKDYLNTENAWYGKEVEFILWGQDNLSTNIVMNDALIFTIRFALNAIYAFTAADIQSFALEVATAIAGWTVVGVPIVQALITLGIAIAESSYDLYLLKNGEDVVIYKNATTFVCSPTGFLKEIGTRVITEAVEAVTETIENELNDLVDKAASGIYSNVDSMINDASSGVTEVVNGYANQFSESVRTAINNIIFNPIMNKIMPIYNMVSTGQQSIETAVNDQIDQVFVEIENNLGLNGSTATISDGIVKEILLQIFDQSSNENGLKDAIKSKITEMMNNAPDISQFDPSDFQDSITGPDGIINNYIKQYSDKFNNLVDDAAQELTDRIHQHGDEACENIKSVIHDEMNSMSSSVTSTASSAISSSVDSFNANHKPASGGMSEVNPLEDATDNAAESGGFTLNYKEYCKIFVLIHIAANEDVMLQRAAAIMQTNVNNPNAKGASNDQFAMTSADTLVSINAKVRMGTLFPWMVADSADDASMDPNVSIDVSNAGSNFVDIKYNGVTGY